MDTSRLKRFAQEARNILMTGVAHRVNALGFDLEGNADQPPVLMDGGCVFMGEIMPIDFYYKWKSLQANIIEQGAKQVVEEAAYTWFNRLVAIRIMAKNKIISPVLEYDSSSARIPVIVAEARKGRTPDMDAASRAKLEALLDSDALTTEQFSVLIVAFCHANPILNACFGRITDYTELLLPNNILAENGFIDMLNNTPFIADDDYKSPELIGWLYQFYISERKDEVFAKKGKFEADEIAPATQIFTPNWIVKYMVQNTIGRIYLDNYDYAADDFKPKWKYLVEPSQPTPAEAIYRFNSLEELKMGDLACGSGHILNEGFDLLYDLYIYEGYSRKDAVTNILTKNLSGIDLDTRAKQLAQFALLLKACQKDISFADAHCMPRILDMPKVDRYTWLDLRGHLYCNLEITYPNDAIDKEIEDCFTLMKDANSLGSIMKFDISDETREFIQHCIEVQSEKQLYEEQFKELFHAFQLILMLTEKYSALVMNPPYMGGGSMNEVLSRYVKNKYEEGKADLFSTFMVLAIARLADKGKYGMINMHSWMFLSSFENMRKSLLDNYNIDSLLHLGPRTFDELSGEVVQNASYIVTKREHFAQGTYFRLVNGKSCAEKERLFLIARTLPKIYYPNVEQENFKKIPGCPIGYWVSEKVISIFTDNFHLSYFHDVKKGIDTGKNDRFVRFWQEVSKDKLSGINGNKKWFVYIKGGTFKRWYGNTELVVNWENDGEEIKAFPGSTIRNMSYIKKEAVTWSLTSSSNLFAARYVNPNCLFDNNGSSAFPTKDKYYLLGLLNSSIGAYTLSIMNPTLAFQVGNIASVPYIDKHDKREIETIAKQNIFISKLDLDAHETSWDFEQNELVRLAKEGVGAVVFNPATGAAMTNDRSLSDIMDAYKNYWEQQFHQLHANEEELNRQFIEIYGLQDELTPDVPLNEITILQQGEISFKNNKINWHLEVIIKQLLSYAVGCMMGRYSLDKPGLILANQGDGIRQFEELVPDSRFDIDDDGIIPLMPEWSSFADNATHRFKAWLAVAFGEDMVNENLNFIEKCLNKTVDDYFVKDFWKDHKKMYQNRPIYWLFSSAKGAFQCLAYMHRMDAFTPERIRTKYLLPHLDWLKQQYHDLDTRTATLSTSERRKMDSLAKQIQECQEYHDILHVVADDHDHLAFDLDDGVVVNYAKFAKVLAKIK